MRLGCRAGLAGVGGGRWAMLDARELSDLGRADVLNLARVEEQRPGRVSVRTDSFPTTIYIYMYIYTSLHFTGTGENTTTRSTCGCVYQGHGYSRNTSSLVGASLRRKPTKYASLDS
jgi:hypothetical protein